MSNLQASGQLLNASIDERTLTYKLLPYGSAGSTNLGKITASQGSVTIPDDVTALPVNLEHDYKQPVGKFTRIEETEDGLIATVSIARTTAGNDALELAASGLRTGISVEIEKPVIRQGALVAGHLSGAGLVVRPAFPAALLIASDFGETEVDEETPSEEEENQETESVEDTTESESEMDNSTAAVPAALNASNAGTQFVPADLKSAVALIASAYANDDKQLAAALERTNVVGNTGLFASLANVSETGNVAQAAWLGELWGGKSYVRKYASLVSTASLTSKKVEGWRFVTTPVVGDYAGFPAEIPTNTVTTEAYSETSQMIAGGWKIDRSHADFGDTEFLNSFFRAATEDYARKSDLKVLTKIYASSTSVTGSAAPEGVNAGMAKIIDGVLAMIDFANPSFALVAPDVYRSILLTRSDDSLQYLSSALGFEDGTVGSFRLVPSPELAPGTVIVGAKEAITLYELPGTPIRLSGLDITHNGSDEAILGYYAIIVNNERGLVKVS
jgi:hypothetical protein